MAFMVARQRPAVAYAVAIGAVALAAWIRLTASDWFIEGVPFLTFFPAVLVATVVGGLGAGLFAAACSVGVAWYFFLEPSLAWKLSAKAVVSLLSFSFVSGLIAGVVSLLQSAIDRIALQEQGQRALIEAAPNGIIVVGPRGEIVDANSSAEKLFGYDRKELIGSSVEMLVPRSVAPVHVGLRSRFQAAPETRPMGAGRDLAGRRKDGSEVPLEIGLNPMEWNGQKAVLAMITDITERKQHEESQAVLARELEHRVGNMFAVILAMIRRTLTRGRNVAEAADILTQRVQLLADAYAVLSESMFKNISLDRLFDIAIGGFKDQVMSTGVNVRVNAKVGQAFSFIVHELLTNAVKHGALSVPSGRVSVRKEIETIDGRQVLVFNWQEVGGPPATAPARKGFGSFILLESPRQFGGEATVAYEPGGLRYELRLPLDSIS
ncbi:PAS domain S-box protein [Methylocystis sp. IM3]|uniref:PAS domain S-box protein n=1 Tax=unclassified Methylocystis TaxID=2625913 RepID=UPI00311A52C7